MIRRNLMNGVALMAIVGAIASCSREVEIYQPTQEEKMANAEAQLGVKIDPNQDWRMTAKATATVTVNGDYDETYTVKIYSNDPLVEKKGYVLTKGQVKSGSTFVAQFDYPTAETKLVVGLTDSHGYTMYKKAAVVDGELKTAFGGAPAASRTRAPKRSIAYPTVPQLVQPSAEYLAQFIDNAVELNDQNNNVNYPGRYWWNSESDNGIVLDENYVINYKISGTWTGNINQLPSAGIKWNGEWDDQTHTPHAELVPRTLYIAPGSKWIVNNWQAAGNGAIADGPDCIIIVANGGEIEIDNVLNMNNLARLIVLPGGRITGTGTLSVNNGNARGNENYNGGTISVATFNNNFGKFYNYGFFKPTEYIAGGKESNFYNHHIVHIDHSAIYQNDYYTNNQAPNARIFNACQWYCDHDMGARNIEMTSGSYMYVGGQLSLGYSEDGTTDPSYVSLADGALLRTNWLYNNGASWQGPTSGYAVVEIGLIKFLNWDGDGPISTGYFANNIAITVDDKTNNCMGKSQENAYQVFSEYVANGLGTNGNTTEVGNGGVVFVEKNGANVSIPADSGFEPGEHGCTPGYNSVPGGTTEDGTPVVTEEEPSSWTYAFEDTPTGDYDMNDVVIRVSENPLNSNKLDVTLCCAGASFDLRVYLGETLLFNAAGAEVHKVLGQASGSLINTGRSADVDPATATLDKPNDFSISDADFWIDSPAVPGGVHVAKAGEDPHGVVIPGNWAWPKEYVSVKNAYPAFARFAEDASTTDPAIKGWYKTPVASMVYSK